MKRRVNPIAALAAASVIAVACAGESPSPGGAGSGSSNPGSSSGGSSGSGRFGGSSGASSGSGPSSGSTSGAPVGADASASSSSGGSGGSGGGGSSGGGSSSGSSGGSGSTSSSGSTSGSSQGGPPDASSPPPPACTPPTSGTAGYATRYWDCCKPSCGTSHTCAIDGVTRNDGAKSSCQGGPAYECYDMAPQVVSDTLAYAFAAYNGASCGTCFQLTFTGKSNDGTMDKGSQQICGKSLIVQVVNTGGLQAHQFDLLIPGGGVGQNNACSTEWKASSSQLGDQFGGLMLQCARQSNYNYSLYPACTISACQSLFANSPTMEAGCEFIINWMKGANNPSVMFTQVSCPSQLRNMSGL